MDHFKRRTRGQEIKDLLSFPLRALFLIENDKWGFSSIRSDRFYYCASQVKGFCLDVGCGKDNHFIHDFLNGNGKGIDVYPYEGLTKENLVKDMTRFPFPNGTFDSVTFIANINHIPRSKRDLELAEAHRCLKKGGNIIVTMGSAIAEWLSHALVWLYDRIFKTRYDMDNQRGMSPEEEYYLTGREIKQRLEKAGFTRIQRKAFFTQWGLNAMYIGWKETR